jgi:osmotically-inducible protein OsmY
MSSLVEKAKDEAMRRLPARFGGREDPVERVESRGRRALNRAQTVGSKVKSGVGHAYDSAESRVRGEDSAARRRKRAAAATAAGAAGGAGAYFLDPISGKRRRHVLRDKFTSLFRRGEERLERAGRYGANTVAGKAKGTVAAASGENEAPNDEALADRVRSEIFRPGDAPKGSVNVNVENGVVYLRGELDDRRRARKLVKAAKSVDGVEEVESLIHTSA